MELITSKQNPSVVTAAKLADKKYRDMTRTFAFEGEKLLSDALSCGVHLTRVFATEAAYRKYGGLFSSIDAGILSLVSEPVYEKLSFERAPQGIFCVAEYFRAPKSSDPSFVLLLDGVSDPGNFGAVLRAADALGVDAVYAGRGGADLYNPKTVRACMGSLFRVDVHMTEDVAGEISRLRDEDFRIYATMLDSRSKDIRSLDFSGKIGFVIGNEGAGISLPVAEACTGSVIIPMREGPQSLNAAVAAGITLWEAARRRL